MDGGGADGVTVIFIDYKGEWRPDTVLHTQEGTATGRPLIAHAIHPGGRFINHILAKCTGSNATASVPTTKNNSVRG